MLVKASWILEMYNRQCLHIPLHQMPLPLRLVESELKITNYADMVKLVDTLS